MALGIIYMQNTSDEYIKQSGINYTIVRPGSLINDPGTGKVKLEEHLSEHGNILRNDVADTLVYLLSVPGAENKSFDLVNGTKPLEEVLVY